MHGALTDEDEEAVLSEYDALIKESLPEVPKDSTIEDMETELPEVPTNDPGTFSHRILLFQFKIKII